MINEQGELLELAPIIRQEIERVRAEERENRSAWQRVKREFAERLNGFDYIEKTEFYVVGKTRGSCEREIRYSWKVTGALSTLLRAVYRVENIAKIPAEKEPEVREFVDQVLRLMEERRREE